MTIAFLIVLFFGLLIIGAPVAVALGGSAIATSMLFSPIPMAIVGQKVLSNLTHETLMAVPFFFFAAAFMETGGLVRRLINLANTLVGHWRGGLGVTSVLSCVFFAAISGSSPATVAAIGRIMYPALTKEGYSSKYALGALATAGSIGILIPPSIPMILYGFVTETSITKLFIAGLIPGLLYGAGLMAMAWFLARKEGVPIRAKVNWKERLKPVGAALPALSLPLLIIIGLYGLPEFSILGVNYSGGAVFTPTEASVIVCCLAILIGFFVYRESSWRTLVRSIIATGPAVGMIFFITTNALIFAFFITQIGLPQMVTQLILSLDMTKWEFLILANILLTIIGFFLEGVPTILMFVPVLFPASQALGIDPVHFGIVIVLNIELGLVTPPVGLNLFVASSITGRPVMEVLKAAIPWMSVTVLMLLLVTYIPEISLFLPQYMYQ